MEQLEDRALLATVGIGPTGLHVAEGGTATLQATLSQIQMQPVTVTFRTVAGTAIQNTDYTGIINGSVTIPPGATFANISVQALNDFDLEIGETFSVELLTASGVTINPSANSTVVTIDNVQSGGGGGSGGSLTVSLSLPSSVDEGEEFTMNGTINASGQYNVTGTIDWGVSPGEGNTTFSVMTNPNGTFSVSYRYVDDGPDPGNGTPQDLQAITVSGTATPMFPGGSNLSVTGSTSTTIHNVAPTAVFDVYNSMPIGGPRWVASGVFQDVGLTDRGTAVITWGDGSADTVFPGLIVGQEFSQMHDYPADGLSYTITITLTDDDTGSVSYSEGFPLYLLDLDNDANNNGAIAANDEPLEPDGTPGRGLPGRYISVNGDDDDQNGVVDMFNSGSVAGENDLERFEPKWARAIRPEISNYDGWKVKLQISPYDVDMANNYPGIPNVNPHVYTTADKSSEVVLVPEGPYLTKTWIVNAAVPSVLYLEARRTGPINMRLTLYTPPGEEVHVDRIFFTAYLLPGVDVDVDSNNDGMINDADDPIEEDDPGHFVPLNRDDDNVNNIEDKAPSESPFLVPFFEIPMDDDDLRLVKFRLLAAAAAIPGYQVQFSNGPKIKLWKTMDKQPFPMLYTIGTDVLPADFYVEGLIVGSDMITSILKDDAGAFVASDSVVVFVGFVELTGYRPQTETAGYGNPFPRTAVPDKYEDVPGVGIRVNGDDDDGDGTFDYYDTNGVNNENDLIEVTIATAPLNVTGVKWFLKRANTDINVFLNSNHTNRLWAIDSPDTELDVTSLINGGLNTLWVEWRIAATNAASQLTLQMRAGAAIVAADAITFNPFFSVVIAFGGWGTDPLNAADGAFVIAEKLYAGDTDVHAGYDVHAYNEINVASAFLEVWDAIKFRNVGFVGIIGYSRGGGATYNLSEALNANALTSAAPLAFTAYIDAMKWSNDAFGNPEDRRPLRSDYHVNYRQSSGKRYGGLLLEGVDTPQGPSVNTNVTVTPWGAALDHLSIDTDIRVVDRIINGFGGPPTAVEPVHDGITDRMIFP